MILGISGKATSGKDTTALLIQQFDRSANWKIMKFAEKWKQFCADILGLKREDLEKTEVKNMTLGHEWDRRQVATLEEIIQSYSSITEAWDDGWYRITESIFERLVPTTVREFMQIGATEGLRDKLHDNFHVNGLLVDYKPIKRHPVSEAIRKFIGLRVREYPNWLVTDLRFFSELYALKNEKAITIRVNRPGVKFIDHRSETELDNAEFDYVINNNGTIEDLKGKISKILIDIYKNG